MTQILETYTMPRMYFRDRTLSSIYRPNGEFVCKALELPWKNNERVISCIPEGTYTVVQNLPKESRPYPYFRFDHVEGRSGILIHRGIKPAHSKGCILVGSRWAKDEDENTVLESSGVKLQYMIDTMPKKFLLQIHEYDHHPYTFRD